MYEVNLVPDIKAELLVRQKMRNLIIYIAIVVAIACGGLIFILLTIMGGQGIALSSQDNEMKEKSDKILATPNLDLNLTIQDQLGKLSQIGNNRRVLSRVFGVLDVILPTGDDTVTVSELSINLPASTLSFDGQANSTSNIDYRALEAFKNTVSLSYYDYGRYIDDAGNAIPSFCIDEVLESGHIIGIYHKGAEGCGEATVVEEDPEEETPTDETDQDSDTTDEEDSTTDPTTPAVPTPTITDIRITRDMTADQLQTAINSRQPYFRSECIKGTTSSCPLASAPVNIRESSNGRDSAGNLVVRFSALVAIDKGVFSFNNKHIRIISPTYQNVTDSYLQVRNMFTEEATECAANDLECINNGGGQ